MSEAFDEMAALALAAWGGTAQPPRLIKARENVVYAADLDGGRRAALRLHRPGYQDTDAIRSELLWCTALVRSRFPTVLPIPTLGGDLVTEAKGRQASLVSWIDGQPVGTFGQPLAGSEAEQAALFRRIGRLAGELHAVTDRIALPSWFQRPRWDRAGLLGQDARWGRFWDLTDFTPPELGEIRRARVAADEALAALQDPDFGLIHADLMRENLLEGPNGLSLIDFDDSGFGYRFYDLGTALVQSLSEPALPALAEALLAGYGEARPLPADAEDRLRLFTMLRALASCGWLAERAEQGHPNRRLYALRALQMVRRYRAGSWEA